MDTKIPDRPPVALHPVPKDVTHRMKTTATAQALDDDKVNYLERLLVVSVTRAIMMCACSALRFLLRLSPRSIRDIHVSCHAIDSYVQGRLCSVMQVARPSARLILPYSKSRGHVT